MPTRLHLDRRLGPYGPLVKTILPIAALVIVGLSLVTSGYHRVRPGEIAVIKNNVTGSETTQTQEGVIVHLPWGLTDVFILDVRQRSLVMTGDDKVAIKTSEGATVETTAELTYRIIPEQGGLVVRRIGVSEDEGADMEKVEAIVYSYARAKIRDAFGSLDLADLAQPELRTARVQEARRLLNEDLSAVGIEVETVSATDWDYENRYEEMIKKRKEAEQTFTNQSAAQQRNVKEQERSEAEQLRLKSNAVTEAQGEAVRQIIEKQAWAEQQRTLAEGESYRIQKEADAKRIQLEKQAQALLKELGNRAQGIEALAAAYADTGLGLVREALAEKFSGVILTGSPYTQDAQPSRIEVVPSESEAAAAAAAPTDGR